MNPLGFRQSTSGRLLRAITTALPLLLIAQIHCQVAQDCAALMRFGIYDKFSVFTSELQFKQIQQLFKTYQFNSRSDAQAKAGSMGIDIIDVLGLTFNGKASSSNFEQWKHELLEASFQQALNAGLKLQMVEKVSSEIKALVEECLKQKGLHAYIIPSADSQNFTVVVDYAPLSDKRPNTKGTIEVLPASVAASCTPKALIGNPVTIGPQGISVAGRRLPTETVTVKVSTDDGQRVLYYEPVTTPKPVVSFSATPMEIDAGQPARLIWNVQNAGKVELVGFGAVNESGTKDVSPAKTEEYQIRVTSLEGTTTSAFTRVTVRPLPPTLVNARINFRTTDDDKDGDTHVTTAIIIGGNTVASAGGTYGHWNDNSDSGWIGLTVIDHRRKNEVLGGGILKVIEAPNGHDEWHFNYTLELGFSDGETRRFDGSGNVDYDRTTITRGL
jgi:hypothetical protein